MQKFGLGGNCVFSVDWLSLTVFTSFDQLEPFIKILGLDAGLEEAGHGSKGFAKLHTGLGGFRVGSEPVTNAQTYCSLVLPGEAMHHVGLEKLVDLFRALDKSGLRWQPSRLDLAFDTQDFTVQDVHKARVDGLIYCRAKRFQEYRNEETYERSSLVGHTLYFGSRQSTCMMRVYHKTDGRSFGTEAFTRCELEMKDERARAVLFEMISHPLEKWATFGASVLAGFFSVESTWWDKFIDSAAGWWVSIARKLSTIEKKRAWLEKQIARSLAAVTMAHTGGDVEAMFAAFRELLEVGLEKFTAHDRALVDAYDPTARQRVTFDLAAMVTA
jgi:DNA relaxase NicK